MALIRKHGWWLLLVIAVTGLLWPRLVRHDQAMAVDCPDIVAGCALPPADAQVRFDQQPDALRRFNIIVTWPGAAEVHASFQMRGMEMGLNRYRLIPDDAGHWRAEVMLPACIQGRKDWLLLLEANGNRYQLPFRSR